jgi:integrase
MNRDNLINRENWLDVRGYLEYLGKVKQLEVKTVHRRREQLVHLLEWAGPVSFGEVRGVDPTFPAYLRGSRRDGSDESLAPTTMRATCSVVRDFFDWARQEMPRRYGKISVSWIETLYPARSVGVQSQVKNHEFFPLEEVVKIARLQVKTLFEERAQAIICLGYLTAMRADALVTLPISCIDIKNKTINQYPSAGVRTKNHKAKQTYILPLPEIFEVVRAWDDKVRSLLPESALWCATIDRSGDNLVAEYQASDGRRQILEKSLDLLCAMAGLKYRNPHQLRHGFTVYAVKQAKSLMDLKAISQQLMHENVGTTDKIYSELTGGDVQSVIDGLVGKPKSDYIDMRGIDVEGLAELSRVLKEHPGLLDALK